MTSLAVFEAGVGPSIVLLHGMPSPPGDLEALASELDGFRVLVPHLPGYGRSPPAPGRQNTSAIIDALVAALHDRDVIEPTLVGCSMGGYRAIALAAALRARSVLALGGFATLSAEERAGMAGFAAALRAGTDLRSVLPERFLSAAHRAAHPTDDAVVSSWMDAATRDALIEELEDVATAPSLLPALAAIPCPVIARAGDLDGAISPSHARTIAATAMRGRCEIVSDAGHALLIEDYAGTVDAIRRAAAID